MRIDTDQLKLTKHAHRQYRRRVERLTYDGLHNRLIAAISAGEYQKHRRSFVLIDGTWWVYRIRKGVLYLVTCYGKCDYDLPAALIWARRGKDRIRLGGEV